MVVHTRCLRSMLLGNSFAAGSQGCVWVSSSKRARRLLTHFFRNRKGQTGVSLHVRAGVWEASDVLHWHLKLDLLLVKTRYRTPGIRNERREQSRGHIAVNAAYLSIRPSIFSQAAVLHKTHRFRKRRLAVAGLGLGSRNEQVKTRIEGLTYCPWRQGGPTIILTVVDDENHYVSPAKKFKQAVALPPPPPFSASNVCWRFCCWWGPEFSSKSTRDSELLAFGEISAV